MTKRDDVITAIVSTLLLGVLLLLALAAWTITQVEPRAPQVVVNCEGDYRVFIRGDQFDVVYDEDCERMNTQPPLLGA